MPSRLVIESGETYTVDSGTTEEHQGATVNGTLDVQGDLRLVDDPEGTPTPTETSTPSQGESASGGSTIDLPMALNIFSMEQGVALFITLTMGALLGAIALVRAWAAGIMWGLAFFTLVVSGLLGIGLEIFWSMVAGSILLLIAGMAVRWAR